VRARAACPFSLLFKHFCAPRILKILLLDCIGLAQTGYTAD
jgi:hypothetical protein